MSLYGDYKRASSDQLSTTSHRSAHGDRQPLSPISAQQQAIAEAKRSFSLNSYSKPPPSYPGILPGATNPEVLLRRGDDDRLSDYFDGSRSSAPFFRVPPTPSFATSATFVDAARLDSSVSDWIDQNRQHFPHYGLQRGSRSRSAIPLLRPRFVGGSHSEYSASVRGGGSVGAGQSVANLPVSTRRSFAPSESGFASTYAESFISGSSIDAASQLRQRHVNASLADGNNDDVASVYTLASEAPSTVAPSIASTATYHNAPENVDDVEMMDLDASMTHSSKNQTGELSSFVSDSDVSSDDSADGEVTATRSKPPSKPSLPPCSAGDPFIRQERGLVAKFISATFRLLRLAFSTAVNLITYLSCLILLLFTIFFLLYTCVYLWTHHRDALVGASGDGPPAIDLADIRAAFDGQLFGQPIARKRIVDALESLVRSENEHRRLLSFHGSTGVGKSHAINLLKRHLPAGAVHILYPDLIVHDWETRDESASTARSTLLRNWLSTRLLRGKDSPFGMIVVENADAHPELVDDIAVAVKDAVDVRDAELLKALDLRKANGLTDVLDEWIDWFFGVPKVVDATELLVKRKLLFVIVSNVGFRHVNAHAYKASKEVAANDRDEGGNDDGDEEAIAAAENSVATTLLERESPFFASLLKTEMKPQIVPFVPLRKDALRKCLLANEEFVDAAAGRSVDDTIRSVIDKAEFFPRNDPTFSVSGCKRIASLLLS